MNVIGVHSRSVFIFAGLLLRSGAPSCFSLMPSRVACGVGRLSAPASGVVPAGRPWGSRAPGWLRSGVSSPAVGCGGSGGRFGGVCCWGRALPSGGVRCGWLNESWSAEGRCFAKMNTDLE